MEYTNRKLYGGAITMNIPKEFDDISNMREVPDHQEVFVDKFSECSIIVELLDLVETNTCERNVAEYHFNDISEFNDSISTKIIYSEPLSEHSSGLLISKCTGIQTIDKRYPQGTQREELKLFLLVLRVVSKNVDVVISFNSPSRCTSFNPPLQVITDQNFRNPSQKEIGEVMDEILASFEIKDYNLFV